MRKWTQRLELLTAALGLGSTIASVGGAVVAARRQRVRMMGAVPDETAGGGGEGGHGATGVGEYEPPQPRPPPPKLPPPPEPSDAVRLLSAGSKALGPILLATPLAPLSIFAGPLLAVLGALADENERAKIAQPRLKQALAYALDGAEYEGYMEAWAAGAAAWEQGLQLQAREYFDGAEAAGRARRLEVAQHIDRLQRDSYRAWMAQPHPLVSARDHLWNGYTLGDGGFICFPNDRDGDRTMVTYRRYADGVTVQYHWQPGHPNYEGVPFTPPTPAEIAAAERAEALRAEQSAYEELFGDGSSEIDDLKRQGGGAVRGRVETARQPAPVPLPPPEPPAPPPPAPPPVSVTPPTKVGGPVPSVPPPTPPAPKPTVYVPPGKPRKGPVGKELPEDMNERESW
ncbi:hypothetical protein NR798_24155 [Archangium gephyra]|uniref:hypothetical protein n=1 Tax=Archangium gephyra TaxID=48 RepID=UPI0035D40279